MLFSLFFSFISSLDYYCQAPNDTPRVLNDSYSLKHITIVTRHGHRAPIDVLVPPEGNGRWECDEDNGLASRSEAAPRNFYRYYHQILDENMIEYPPSCRPGDLTVVGMRMHEELGGKYRKYLVNDLKFLPEKMKPSLFKFYSSPVERTFRSAEGFISGLYPPQSDNEVLQITMGTLASNPINAESCQEFVDQKAEFEVSETYTNFVDSIWPTIQEAAEYFGMEKTNDNAHTICGWAVAYNCSVGSIGPSWMTDEFMAACRRDTWMMQYGVYNYTTNHSVLAAAPMRQIIANMNNAIMNQDRKFSLLSAHDTTVASILVLLDCFEDRDVVPQYASHLACELFERNEDGKKFIRFTFNGIELTLPHFGESLVPFDDFVTYITPYLDHCNDFVTFDP